MATFLIPPPTPYPDLLVSHPAEHVLLLTLNRPKQLNAMNPSLQAAIEETMDWFEEEPSLWVVIITGAGRAFCAGQDLKLWLASPSTSPLPSESSKHGFASISRRRCSKPIIAAINGVAMGGGVELLLNCDLVVASEDATFALPEVSRGVVAAQGGIPRLAGVAGHQLASEMLLLGRPITAREAHTRFGFINKVVPHSRVLDAALELANIIIQNSPDAVWSTKVALMETKGDGHEVGVDGAVKRWEAHDRGVGFYTGENIKEGLKAFTEKRAPVWQNPKPTSRLRSKL